MSRSIHADVQSVAEILPPGWTTARIGDVLKLYNGAAFKPSQWSTTGLPIIRIQNLNNAKARFNYFEGELHERFRVRKGDLLFAWSGTPGTSFGAHIWKGGDAWLNQHIFRVEFDPQLFDRKFLRMAINRNLNAYIGEAHGGAGLAHITKGRFEAFDILLPPLPEQRRIVARLEALEARSRRAREQLAEIPAQLAQARQSLLAAAFRGDLTADWGDTKKTNWSRTPLARLVKRMGSGATPRGGRESYHSNGVPLIRSMNVRFEGFTTEGLAFLDDEQASALKSVEVVADDVLFNITGASIGRVCLAPKEMNGARVNQHVMRIRPADDLLSGFLGSFLESPEMQNFVFQNETGTTRQALTKKQLEEFQIPLPPLPEQHEIVRRLTTAFAKLDAAATAHTAAVADLDRLDQSLLARAFSGGLVSPEAAPSIVPATPSTSVQTQLYLLRFIPALLRATGHPVSLADLNAVVALRFLPAALLLPVVERLGGAPARAHFAASAPVTYEDGAFLAVMQRLRQADAIVVSPGRRGIPSLSLGAQSPPSTAAVDVDARLLAPLLSRVPVERVEPILRRLQSAEVQAALLTTP